MSNSTFEFALRERKKKRSASALDVLGISAPDRMDLPQAVEDEDR